MDEKTSCNDKIEKIITYLQKSQLSNGSFRTLRKFTNTVGNYVTPSEFDEWYEFGMCTFSTANILYHLSNIDHPVVDVIKKKASEFLLNSIEGGVVRYVPAQYKEIDFPADIDCTCLAQAALKCNCFDHDFNLKMIINNADSEGNFFTWFVPRAKQINPLSNFIWLLKDYRKCKSKMKEYGFSLELRKKIHEEYKTSKEPAILANVLLGIGDEIDLKYSRRQLIDLLLSDNFTIQYYKSKLDVFFHTARLYKAGFSDLEIIASHALKYINNNQKNDGEVESPFHTAVAALILMYFNLLNTEEYRKSLSYCISNEMHEKGWKPFHYFNDLHGIFYDGSAEVTATLFLEAIYTQNKINEKQ